MKNEIYWNLELAIKPGKADALTELAKEMTARTKESEPGTLGYIWNVNADDSENLMGQADIDGGLVGGAALKPDSFLGLIKNGCGA